MLIQTLRYDQESLSGALSWTNRNLSDLLFSTGRARDKTHIFHMCVCAERQRETKPTGGHKFNL